MQNGGRSSSSAAAFFHAKLLKRRNVYLKLTRHNGRAGAHGTYNPKHNDRSFNLANSEHIDPERAKGNIYWDCFHGFRSALDPQDPDDLAATFSEVLGFDEYLTALMDLQNGGCDAVLMDLVVGDYRINGMGATDLKAAVALTDDNYGIGFRKEDIALRDKVEELLIEMKKDGTLEKISTQWFGSDITVVPAE